MRILKFYGASDDLFEFEDSNGDCNEIGGYRETSAYLVSSPTEGSMFVTATYSSWNKAGGTWSIGIAPIVDGEPIPNWEMEMVLSEGGYSTMLIVHASADVKVTPC